MGKPQSKNTANHTDQKTGSNPVDALNKMDALLERRDAINQRVADIKIENGEIFTKRQLLENAIFNLQDRLHRIPEDSEDYAEKRQKLTVELEQTREDFAQMEAYKKALGDEIKQLQDIELPACMVALCAEDVIEHQKRVHQAAVDVTNIQAAIDSQNQSIADAMAAIPQDANRQQERHNLLADMALGNASEGDLKKLDTIIAKEQQVVAEAEKHAAPLIENAKATVSGLERKLAAAKETLQALESKSDEVAHRYFMGEAEKAAVQYVNQALSLKELHLRLLGLDRLINKHDGIGIVRHGAKPIQIPLFRLPQFDGLGNPGAGNLLLLDGDNIYLDHAEQAAEIEKTRFNQILDGHFY